ncbi:MAG: hypothetical protein ACK55I_27415, partial [bacterium]
AAEDAEDRADEDDAHRHHGAGVRDVGGSRALGAVPAADRVEEPEVDDHGRRDQEPQEGQELALLAEVALAGLPDDVGDVAHRRVDRQRVDLPVLDEAEERADDRDHQAAP